MKEKIIEFIHSDETELSKEVIDQINNLSITEKNDLYHQVLDSIQSDRNYWNKNRATMQEVKLINKTNKLFFK